MAREEAAGALAARVLQDLVITASAREKFAALFVTHDLSEAARLAHRILVMSGRDGSIRVDRTIAGTPGERDDRAIFETVQGWMHEAAFAELFDPDRDRA